MYRHQVRTLDRRRATERADVHFEGNAAAVLDYNRACTPVGSLDQLKSIIDKISAEAERPDSEIVGINNRFAVPSSSGYRDLKYLLRSEDNFISTGRVVFTPFEEDTFFKTMAGFWGIRAIYARAELRGRELHGHAVIVADNYHRDDEHSCLVVHGFPDSEAASAYARARIEDGLRQNADPADGPEALRANWVMFGEDMFILRPEPEGDSYLGGAIRAIIMELPASRTKPYWEMEEAYKLGKFSLDADP